MGRGPCSASSSCSSCARLRPQAPPGKKIWGAGHVVMPRSISLRARHDPARAHGLADEGELTPFNSSSFAREPQRVFEFLRAIFFLATRWAFGARDELENPEELTLERQESIDKGPLGASREAFQESVPLSNPHGLAMPCPS